MRSFLILLLSFSVLPVLAQSTVYVDVDASGLNDGTSWADAFVHLQDALSVAESGDEVWIAEGVYRPDAGLAMTPGDTAARFEVKGSVRLHGGFAGNEASLLDRPSPLLETVLSGDLNGNDLENQIPDRTTPEYQDNSLRLLLTHEGTEEEPTILDGVTIRGATSHAVAALGPCRFQDVTIEENVGALIGSSINCVFDTLRFKYNRAEDRQSGAFQVSQATIRNSTFEFNEADDGGALQVWGSESDSVFVSNSTFYSNRAGDGGAIVNSGGAHLVVVSTKFIANEARCAGGAIAMDENGSLTSINNVYAFNHSLNQTSECGPLADGGALWVYKSRFHDFNSTFVSNSSVAQGDHVSLLESEGMMSNVILQGNSVGSQDIKLVSSTMKVANILHDETLDPAIVVSGTQILQTEVFDDPAGPDGVLGTNDDQFTLHPSSGAIDAGDAVLLPVDFADVDNDGDRQEPQPFDISGQPRVQAGNVDLGAYESSTSTGTDTEPDYSKCFQAYPNPFSGSLNIKTDYVGGGRAKIFDVLGRVVRTIDLEAGAQQATLDTFGLAPGLYLVSLDGYPACSNTVVRR